MIAFVVFHGYPVANRVHQLVLHLGLLIHFVGYVGIVPVVLGRYSEVDSFVAVLGIVPVVQAVLVVPVVPVVLVVLAGLADRGHSVLGLLGSGNACTDIVHVVECRD